MGTEMSSETPIAIYLHQISEVTANLPRSIIYPAVEKKAGMRCGASAER